MKHYPEELQKRSEGRMREHLLLTDKEVKTTVKYQVVYRHRESNASLKCADSSISPAAGITTSCTAWTVSQRI